MKKLNLKYLLAFLCFAGMTGCREDDSRLFTLLGPSTTGIDFKNVLREDESANVMNYLYFYNGGGVATGDINNDGLPDILFTGNMVPNRLYLNKGNFQFEDISKKAGIAEHQGWCTGASMVDINQDGLLDIYICRSADVVAQRRQNLLFINEGDLRFTEQAALYGLADQGYSTQSAFLDYDRDGDLDMFLINHSQQQYAYGAYENVSLRSQQNENFASKLYRNDGGRFTDISRQAGIVSNVLSFGLGVAVSDLNKDGWPDIYVSNDFNEPDYLFINNKNGTFSEQVAERMDQVSLFSMGSDCADINNDCLPDIVTLDMLPEDNYMQKMHSGAENFNKFRQLFNAGFYYQYSRNMLHLNNGDGTFSEIAQWAGVSNTDWSWAPLLADFDNDGKKDLFVTNGYARDYTNMDFMKYRMDQMAKEKAGAPAQSVQELLAQMPSIKIENYAFRQDSSGSFDNRAREWGLNQKEVSSGAAYADLDNDGDLDLIVSNINSPASVYRNNANKLYPQSHYLKIKLAGPPANRNAIGATVTVYCGADKFYVEQQTVRGFQSSVEPVLHVGLASYQLADSILIKWPDGNEQTILNQPLNRQITVQWKPAQQIQVDKTTGNSDALFQLVPSLDYTQKENGFNDFTVQTLLPGYMSRSGPCLAKGDINGDGLEDIFIGSPKGQPSELWLQQPNGIFRRSLQPALEKDSLSEDVRALFFDTDNDGDLDLYVASGGYEYAENDPLLQDRLYLNNGKGQLTEAAGALPGMFVSSSAVTAADMDKDGDLDLFIGGRVVPGKYPLPARSFLLLNDGKGHFSDVTPAMVPALSTIGLVTDAVWTDVNADQWPDLVVVGEWMPVHVFVNNKGTLADSSSAYIKFPSHGFWNRILCADMDNDGDEDLLIGNTGNNGQLRASAAEPVTLLYKDFDKNGSIDPVLSYYIQGVSYPAASRDDLVEQLPLLNKKFLGYEAYAKVTSADLFLPEQLTGSSRLKAEILETVWLENNGINGFSKKALPKEVQYAPVFAMAAEDLNKDGRKDILLAGNFSWARIKLGRYRANHGLVLIATGKGDFRPLTPAQSGLSLRGDTRDMTIVNSNGSSLFIFGINDSSLQSYKIKAN